MNKISNNNLLFIGLLILSFIGCPHIEAIDKTSYEDNIFMDNLKLINPSLREKINNSTMKEIANVLTDIQNKKQKPAITEDQVSKYFSWRQDRYNHMNGMNIFFPQKGGVGNPDMFYQFIAEYDLLFTPDKIPEINELFSEHFLNSIFFNIRHQVIGNTLASIDNPKGEKEHKEKE